MLATIHLVNANNDQKESSMSTSGSFDIKLEPQQDPQTPAGRLTIHKEYSGGLVGTGIGQMISKRTENGESVYSAIEEFVGSVDGKEGAFTLFHTGLMSSTTMELKIAIVEGSGSGELVAIKGEMSITQLEGGHQYKLNYSL